MLTGMVLALSALSFALTCASSRSVSGRISLRYATCMRFNLQHFTVVKLVLGRTIDNALFRVAISCEDPPKHMVSVAITNTFLCVFWLTKYKRLTTAGKI